MRTKLWATLAACLAMFPYSAMGQTAQPAQTGTPIDEHGLPISTTWLIDAAGPLQRKAIESVFMITCGSSHGTGFLLKSGLIATNSHVVSDCQAQDLVAKSSKGKVISFSKCIKDDHRDLALLVPAEKMKGGLELGSDKSLVVGKALTSWGFPLIYDSGAPVLTLGYVAGFNAVSGEGSPVKHIIVNGAFNPGNSGGPVFLADDDKVVGIVVWKQVILDRWVGNAIKKFEVHSGYGTFDGFTKRLPNGTVINLSNDEVIGAVLEEFYNVVQVMIGEAISVDELKAFQKDHEDELR